LRTVINNNWEQESGEEGAGTSQFYLFKDANLTECEPEEKVYVDDFEQDLSLLKEMETYFTGDARKIKEPIKLKPSH